MVVGFGRVYRLLVQYYFLLNIFYFVELTLHFKQRSYSIEESKEFVNPMLVLSNPSAVNITVIVFTTDGSATGEWHIRT